MAGVEEITHISKECVDDARGLPGVIVYDDKTYPIPSQQETGFGAEHGPHSSVRPFNPPLFRLDEECDQPDLK